MQQSMLCHFAYAYQASVKVYKVLCLPESNATSVLQTLKQILPSAAFQCIQQDWFRIDSNKPTKNCSFPQGTAPSYRVSNQESN